MTVELSRFASGISVETAFNVLAVAKQLKAAGKDVVELEIGDSPFDAPEDAKRAAMKAVESNQSHYCPSAGLPAFREAVVRKFQREFDLEIGIENVVAGPGAKTFELLFCEALLNPNDGVLVFSPYFPTYLPNIARRNGRVWLSDLKQETAFRPSLADVERFLQEDPSPKAIFLNSPHNPTGGVATEEDLRGLADLIRGKNIAVFSDEPYEHMVWHGKHHTLLSQPGMFEQCVSAYTFSKSYSMSGYRLGYAVSSPKLASTLANLINTSLSCVPPIAQLAGVAALDSAAEARDAVMQRFRAKVEVLVAGLNKIEGIHCLDPGGTFYVFPKVAAICNRLRITSHGLAMFLLEAADENFGVACLGGECFGSAGQGFLRFSCAEPDERLQAAIDFLPRAFAQTDRLSKYLEDHPQYRLGQAYEE